MLYNSLDQYLTTVQESKESSQGKRDMYLSKTLTKTSHLKKKLENVFVEHYAPNQMPDPKGERSLLENINGNYAELISPSTYHLQSSDKDASPEVQCFSKFQMLKIFKGP